MLDSFIADIESKVLNKSLELWNELDFSFISEFCQITPVPDFRAQTRILLSELKELYSVDPTIPTTRGIGRFFGGEDDAFYLENSGYRELFYEWAVNMYGGKVNITSYVNNENYDYILNQLPKKLVKSTYMTLKNNFLQALFKENGNVDAIDGKPFYRAENSRDKFFYAYPYIEAENYFSDKFGCIDPTNIKWILPSNMKDYFEDTFTTFTLASGVDCSKHQRFYFNEIDNCNKIFAIYDKPFEYGWLDIPGSVFGGRPKIFDMFWVEDYEYFTHTNPENKYVLKIRHEHNFALYDSNSVFRIEMR